MTKSEFVDQVASKANLGKKEASDEAEPWTRVNPPRPAIDGQFRQPTDVTWGPNGEIYAAWRHVFAGNMRDIGLHGVFVQVSFISPLPSPSSATTQCFSTLSPTATSLTACFCSKSRFKST